MKTGSNPQRGAQAAFRSPVYLDASALLKLYYPEAESDQLNRALLGRRDLFVSDLALTEIASALARRRREGLLGAETVGLIHASILEHVESGVYRRAELVPPVHREAERILLSLETLFLRAADALHAALAAAAGAKTVVTFDRRLSDASRRLGFSIWPA